jgi:hypothetical protein
MKKQFSLTRAAFSTCGGAKVRAEAQKPISVEEIWRNKAWTERPILL